MDVTSGSRKNKETVMWQLHGSITEDLRTHPKFGTAVPGVPVEILGEFCELDMFLHLYPGQLGGGGGG